MIREDMMLTNLHHPLPGIENAGEMAKKAANSAAQAAKDATGQLQDWAKDGYGSARDAVKTKPYMWGAVSLGFGALMGGLYTLWRRGTGEGRRARKTLPARARAKQSLTKMNGANGSAAKPKPKRTRRAPPAMNA